jgi:hypothetical protein
MVYLYDTCDQISDFCHQQLLRKISWTEGRTDRGKTVYPPPPVGERGIINLNMSITAIMLDSASLTVGGWVLIK